MGEPLLGLDADALARFASGRVVFDQFLTEEDGLGPGFNDISCGLCHLKPGSGGFSERTVTLFGCAGPPFDPLTRFGGPLRQAQATNPLAEEFVPVEADRVATRITPHLFGVGLIDRIPDQVLERLAASGAEETRGRVHWVSPLEGGPLRAGRFGWKSQQSTLLSFTGDAARSELGLTNRVRPEELAPGGDAVLLGILDRTVDPEDTEDEHGLSRIDHFMIFQELLAPPPQTPRAGMTGERIFTEIGCADCHVPAVSLPEREPKGSPAPEGTPDPFSGVVIRAYSDFLLHEMGTLSDGIEDGDARPTEMRTAPLWGMSVRRFFAHDGKSFDLAFAPAALDVIARHDGQARASRDRFMDLDATDRDAVVAFLASLGQAEFDVDQDHHVGPSDWAIVEGWMEGPHSAEPQDTARTVDEPVLQRITPDDVRAVADVDGDGDLDMHDFRVLQLAWRPPGESKDTPPDDDGTPR